MEQTSTSMDCAPLNAPSALGLENTGVDKNVKFSDGQKGLLVCQIGYALPGVRVAYLVAPEKATLDAISAFTVVNEEGSVILAGKPMYSGEWVTAHFSTLDLSGIRTPGRYRVVAGGLVSNLFPVTTPNGLFFAPHYQGMMIGQMRIRKRTDERGGYIDCGNDIRETNSHATQLRGIMDMLDLHPELLGTEEKSEIEAILAHLEAFFLNQQMETGIILGGWWGDQRIENMGQWPNHLRGVYSLLRLARYFETTNPEESRKLLAAVKRGMEYSLMNSETEKTSSTLLTMHLWNDCLLYTSPSPRDRTRSRMPSSA